jgi:hypothetical protein
MCFCFYNVILNITMSSIFEELNDLITENPVGKVLGITLLVLVFSGAIALGFAYWITHRH